MAIGHIYKLTTPDNMIYIGKTKNLVKRYWKYKSTMDQGLMCIEIKKWGWDRIEKEILFEGEYNESLFSDLERHYIRFYNTFESEHGLNSQTGGKKGFKVSKSSSAKMGESRLGMIIPDHVIEKRREAMLGKTWKIRFEGKANNSRTKRDGKEILDMSFGIYYDTISEAAESLGIKRTTLSAKLVGRRINNTNIKYV
ncbi:GIY-YIG nuclease family protein [Sphingobacterium sp. ML3W]|uniref:GIY-YIG nuclease family protein n=1 Tax=Sphingobacterium sp. ML3W TaxID=1538644 RepID=UPI00249BC91D|nr:GIY-YIG nuclease family protein [Sphingobacterium sp. ML3W]WFA79666.1 GIY-YIG nuclease family protein [Sphingobacterium sp. ML3W]